MKAAVTRRVGGPIGAQQVLQEIERYEATCVADLLNTVPADGGNISREMLERLVSTAFVSGVLHAANAITKSEI